LKAKRTEILIRQREYPELESAFKQLKLLDEDITFAGMESSTPGENDGAIGDDGAERTKLVKPLV